MNTPPPLKGSGLRRIFIRSYARNAPSLREVNEICRARAVYHISDEAYEYFTYGGAKHFSPGSIEGSSEHFNRSRSCHS